MFSELGGDGLLGKARELADETGDRVLALTSAKESEKQQKLIHLGADEVLVCPVKDLGDWVPIISKYATSDDGLKTVIFPSGNSSNSLMGMIYGVISERISPYFEDVQSLSGNEVAKNFEGSLVIQKQLSSEKIALISLDRPSFAEPFEDAMRFGKIKNLPEGFIPNNSSVSSFPEILSNSKRLVVLLGQGLDSTAVLANQLAEKYRGIAKVLSGKIEIIYGACVAIEVPSKLRELPEFRGELISISSKRLPINDIAELSVVTSEVDRLLENLVA